MKTIYIGLHSLKYEPVPSQFMIVDERQYFYLKLKEYQDNKTGCDYYIQRYGFNKWKSERDATNREQMRKNYNYNLRLYSFQIPESNYE